MFLLPDCEKMSMYITSSRAMERSWFELPFAVRCACRAVALLNARICDVFLLDFMILKTPANRGAMPKTETFLIRHSLQLAPPTRFPNLFPLTSSHTATFPQSASVYCQIVFSAKQKRERKPSIPRRAARAARYALMLILSLSSNLTQLSPAEIDPVSSQTAKNSSHDNS